MENKEESTKTMSEWDKQVCARLDYLWNGYRSGEIEVGNIEDAHAKLFARAEKALREHQKERAKATFHSPNNVRGIV